LPLPLHPYTCSYSQVDRLCHLQFLYGHEGVQLVVEPTCGRSWGRKASSLCSQLY
jgi:hypothetical protein